MFTLGGYRNGDNVGNRQRVYTGGSRGLGTRPQLGKGILVDTTLLARSGKVNRTTGTATISGTYTCIGTADVVQLSGKLQQEQGDAQISGLFEQLDLTCGGTADWKIEVVPDSGKFKRGQAATIALAVGCNLLGCNFYETLEVVRLR
jgi:hypothetical protein